MTAQSPVVAAPCGKCPFRRDVPIYLRLERRREIVHSVMVEGADFHCHQTVDYSEDGDGDPHGASVCAGAAKMIEAAGGSTQMTRIAENLGMYDPTRDRGAAVWTVDEFMSLAEGSVDGAIEVEDDLAEIETCSVVGDRCLAPAGWGGVGGGAIRGTEAADGRCVECDEPVCSNCMNDDGVCDYCAENEDDE